MDKHTIVYADDDLDDLMIVQQAFLPYGDQVQLLHVPDGVAALKLLEQLCQQERKPCLVILDMNMPIMGGRQVLLELRRSEQLCRVPVVLFTTSSNPMDKAFAAQMGVPFFTKPIDFTDLEEMARTFVGLCSDGA